MDIKIRPTTLGACILAYFFLKRNSISDGAFLKAAPCVVKFPTSMKKLGRLCRLEPTARYS